MDTIFAQSSNVVKSGVAVFRISGTLSKFVLKKLLNISSINKLHPRVMYYRKIYDPLSLEIIDHAMVVYFNAPYSFTGEDVLEIHAHGSIAVFKKLTYILSKINGLRIAYPGEFSRRAFLNKKFDLTYLEGLSDLINAETSLQHKQAISLMNGYFSNIYDTWRDQLLIAVSSIEAYIDFPDEEIPIHILDNVNDIIQNLINSIASMLNNQNFGELLKSGLLITILGNPNVGKSTLMNFFLKREISIISSIPGTTRDVVEGHIDICGIPVTIRDTAGIRENTSDIIEQEGIKRAKISAKVANIKIVVFDASNIEYNDSILSLIDDKTIIVINKIDLNPNVSLSFNCNNIVIKISLKNNSGVDFLIKTIEDSIKPIIETLESPQITTVRHVQELENAYNSLSNFQHNKDLVLAAEDIRIAIRCLSHLTGNIMVDDILDRIFSNFCIGK